jgi:hypothetical protein
MVRLLANRRLAAILLAVATCITVPAEAQGLRLGLDGGRSDADVDVGGVFDADGAADLSRKSGLVVAINQQLALEAVRKHRALPLEDIMLRAKLLTDGEIIDARLISVDNILLYELKVLGKAGEVSQLFFYARSGAPVEIS